MTAYVVASPVILPYKAAKWTYNKSKPASTGFATAIRS